MISAKNVVRKRLMDNKKMFTNKELKRINRTHEKIYLIGLADGKKIYN